MSGEYRVLGHYESEAGPLRFYLTYDTSSLKVATGINDAAESEGKMQPLGCLLDMVPGFDSLDRTLVELVASVSRIVDVPADAILCRQGAAPDALHWLLDGQVALSQAGPSQESAIIDILQPISGITLASAVLGQRYPMTAEVLTRSRVMEIQAAPLRALTATHPALATTFMRAVSLDIASATRQIVDLKLRKTAQRLGGYLLSLARAQHSAAVRLPISKGVLAGKLGCRQENLSRAFGTLRDFGVETHGSRVIIYNIPQLREFSACDDPDPAQQISAADAFRRAFDL
ncbi:MAG TPA: cyclic nucleotide-binding domain-containing protein [Acetobacteraceae bacterium]|nr:cyclic nucleotide-binding domain-containing protein [Acetobacteraceae bacterium]